MRVTKIYYRYRGRGKSAASAVNGIRKLAVVFDPSAGWLEAIADTLSASGITVVGRACELTQARELVERHEPELLVADAGDSGLDVIRSARSRVPALRAIALGASGDAALVADAFAAGAAAFVVKTEHFDTFGAAAPEPVLEAVSARARATAAA
jgi:DNA-binding NarL/FixJ family response regulator